MSTLSIHQTLSLQSLYSELCNTIPSAIYDKVPYKSVNEAVGASMDAWDQCPKDFGFNSVYELVNALNAQYPNLQQLIKETEQTEEKETEQETENLFLNTNYLNAQLRSAKAVNFFLFHKQKMKGYMKLQIFFHENLLVFNNNTNSVVELENTNIVKQVTLFLKKQNPLLIDSQKKLNAFLLYYKLTDKKFSDDSYIEKIHAQYGHVWDNVLYKI